MSLAPIRPRCRRFRRTGPQHSASLGQISPMACPSWRYIRLTTSWSTSYLIHCPRRALPRGGSDVSSPASAICFRDAAMVGTGMSRAAAISARVAGPLCRKYPMMPARTRLPKALMGSSSHSFHPPAFGFTCLGIPPILAQLTLNLTASKVDVLTIHFHECMSIVSTCASVIPQFDADP